MSTHYRLYPPFLCVPEKHNFPDVWEHFCCKLLNLQHGTSEIYVRNPPEQGIDLWYPSARIAYQCKCVESGKAGDFNVTKAIESVISAKAARHVLGWEKYVLCVNVPVTGGAEKRLKEVLPDIDVMSESVWLSLCEKHPLDVERNFRKLLDVPQNRFVSAISNTFSVRYNEELRQQLEDSPFDIFLYSSRQDSVFRIPVAGSFTAGDVINILRNFFRLPKPATFSDENIQVSLNHSLVFDGKKVPLKKTLGEVGVVHGSVVTFWTQFAWKDLEDFRFDGDVIHYGVPTLSKEERRDRALARYKRIIQEGFREAETGIITDISAEK